MRLYNHYHSNLGTSLKTEPGSISEIKKHIFTIKMKNENLHKQIIEFATTLFVFACLCTKNRVAKLENDSTLKYVQTLTGTIKTAQLSHSI